MAKFVSRRAEVGIAKEANRGTGVVPTQWLPWSSVGYQDKIEHVIEEAALGRIENSDDSYATLRFSEGTVEAEVRAAYLGLILTNLLGAAPSTSGSNPYTHTFALAQNNQHQSLSLLVQDKTNPDINKLFANVMINSWTMTVEPGQIVKNTIEFMGKKGRDWTTQTANFTAMGLKFLHQHLAFKVAANIAGIAAASALNLRMLELKIEKNIERVDVNGTVDPEDFVNQDLKITGSLALSYEDSTWLDYMLNQTDRAMEIKLNAGAAGILTMQFPKVHFNAWEKDMPLSETAKQKIEFVAHYDAANATAVISTCTLVNAVTSY